VIIATREAELLVMIIYARTDMRSAVEVQRRIFTLRISPWESGLY